MPRGKSKNVETETQHLDDAPTTSAIDDLDQLTPPIEIGEGNMYRHSATDARRISERVGPLFRAGSEGPRPGGNAPDKRVRIDPAPCDIPKRTSDTTLF